MVDVQTSKKLTCVVTGKSTVYAGAFLQKKIQECGSNEDIEKYYICREVKAYLKKGYKIVEIVKILNVPGDFDLPPLDVINKIESKFKGEYLTQTDSTALSSITSLTYDKSDPDVEMFINTHIIKT